MTFPIVALWAHPRSMSTAFERIMRERGDCTVFHEPFLGYYYSRRAQRTLPLHRSEQEQMPDTYAGVCETLLAAGRSGPVFFKDMSYYVVPPILSDPSFCERLVNVFLIRDPRRSIASYYKLDPQMTLPEIGLEAQWQHFCALAEGTGEEPLVVCAEDIQRDPRGTLAEVWRRAGLEFIDDAFEWRSGDVPPDWERVAGWHGNVLASTGIAVASDDAQNVFDKAVAEAPHLRDFLAHHEIYYDRLRDFARSRSMPDPDTE